MKHPFIVLITVLSVAFACKKENANNNFLRAVAGVDKEVSWIIDTVVLDGSNSTATGGTVTISAYNWKQISGPSSAAIVGSSLAKTTVRDLVLGLSKFELTVTSNSGMISKDTLSVNVAFPSLPSTGISFNATWDQDVTGLMYLKEIVSNQSIMSFGAGLELSIFNACEFYVKTEGSANWIKLPYVFSGDIRATKRNFFISTYTDNISFDSQVFMPRLYATSVSGIDFTKKAEVFLYRR